MARRKNSASNYYEGLSALILYHQISPRAKQLSTMQAFKHEPAGLAAGSNRCDQLTSFTFNNRN
jgi:hypothetical protein